SFWMTEFADNEIIEPIDDRLEDVNKTPEFFDYEGILPAYRNGLDKHNDIAYGVQIAGESRFLAYRTDLFEEHGQEPPETLEEMLEIAQYFDEEVEDVYGIAMRAQKGIHFTSGLLTILYQFSDGLFDPETEEN